MTLYKLWITLSMVLYHVVCRYVQVILDFIYIHSMFVFALQPFPITQRRRLAKNVEFVNKHFVVLMNRLVTTKINPRKIANILTIQLV
jgi:hypothetical protein